MKNHVTPKDPKNVKLSYIFFYFEDNAGSQDTPADKPGHTLHKPNLCDAEQTWYEYDGQEDINNPCTKCGDRQYIFDCDGTLSDFMDFVTHQDHILKRLLWSLTT